MEKEIQELLDNGCISEVIDRPEFINPLHVASQSSGKKRLILDPSHLNNFIVKTSVKCEDLKTVIQFLKSDYVFSFDIKSGYHHIGIFEEHRKYLSLQFEDGTIRCFHFNVLPFGLSQAQYVFTEVMCQVTKYLDRKASGLCCALTMGWVILGGAGTFKTALKVSQQVKSDLTSSGFTPNQKSVWIPTQKLLWLGHVLGKQRQQLPRRF